MSVSVGPFGLSATFSSANLQIIDKVTTPAVEQIDGQLNSSGRRAVGEHAFEDSLKRLSKMFDENNIQVTSIFDVQDGTQIRITDGDTGKPIIDLPPHAAVEIASRAKERHVGLIVDLLA